MEPSFYNEPVFHLVFDWFLVIALLISVYGLLDQKQEIKKSKENMISFVFTQRER